MWFEWDKSKNELNIRKHGLDFADACEIFDSPMLVLPDKRRDYGEERLIGLGKVKGRVVVVAYTHRRADVIRIISFRKANSREKKRYEAIAHKLEAR